MTASGLRVLVTGSRYYKDISSVHTALNSLERYGVACVIAGGKLPPCEWWQLARGADRLALEWAVLYGVPRSEYPAKWKEFGNPAGPIRNQQMIDEAAPDVVVAFAGHHGTFDCVNRARKAGLPIFHADVGRWEGSPRVAPLR